MGRMNTNGKEENKKHLAKVARYEILKPEMRVVGDHAAAADRLRPLDCEPSCYSGAKSW